MNKENIIDYVVQTPHNPNKKVLDDMLETLIEENGGGNASVSEQIAEAIAKIPQNDWNQNDETAKDYIKNRPFYEESKGYTILENQQLRDTGDDFFFEGIVPYGFTIGDTVNVKFSGDDDGDDVIYTAVAVPYDSRNNAAQLPEYEYSEFGHCNVYCWEDNGEIWVEARSFSHTNVTITVSNETIKHIDPKYIKDMYYETKPVEIILVDNLTFEDYDNDNYPACNFIPGQKYKVIWNGETYDNLVCCSDGSFNIIASPNVGCPFRIDDDGGDGLYIVSDNEDEAWIVSIIEYHTEIHQIDPKYIPDSVKTHDWNTLENKPFGEETSLETYIEEQTVEFVASGSESRANVDYLQYIEYNAICNVYFDGVLYENIAAYESGGDMCVYVEFTTENGDRISICESSSIYAPASYAGQTHTIKVEVKRNIITQIDNKYIDFPVISVNGETGRVNLDASDIGAARAIDLNNKMDKSNPTGSGSFSMGRKANTTVGIYSHTEGYSTTASGEYSHAEGRATTASGNHSHVEGYLSTASGTYSHAEGYNTKASNVSSHAEGADTIASASRSHAEGQETIASGDNSHAEGYRAIACGKHSHAEGEGYIIALTITGDANSTSYTVTTNNVNVNNNVKPGRVLYRDTTDTYAIIIGYDATTRTITTNKTLSNTALNNGTVRLLLGMAFGDDSHTEGFGATASGLYSHSEGYLTTAFGDHSHAEGFVTNALSSHQHVQGKYNIDDSGNKYAHIVGNGTSHTERSNAHTLDWEGNAWFAGSVEGTALILLSPNGTRFNITVGDDGVLSATEMTE